MCQMETAKPSIDTHHLWSRSTFPPRCIICGVMRSKVMDLDDKGKVKPAWSYNGKDWLFTRPNCTRKS